jgi:hypothetical protein
LGASVYPTAQLIRPRRACAHYVDLDARDVGLERDERGLEAAPTMARSLLLVQLVPFGRVKGE